MSFTERESFYSNNSIYADKTFNVMNAVLDNVEVRPPEKMLLFYLLTGNKI